MSLWQLSEEYLASLATAARSPYTIRNQRCYLGRFLAHIEAAGVYATCGLTRAEVEQYMEELTWTAGPRGKPLAVTTRNYYLATIRGFTRWLYEHDHASADAAANVAYAKESDSLPRNVPSEEEMGRLLATPSRRTVLGFRDALILELLYATGMRIGEASGLDVSDVELEGGWAHVREGKCAKDRVVPLGRRASESVRCYLAGIRPQLERDGGDGTALLLNYKGRRFSPTGIGRLVVRYVEEAELGEGVTAHSLRHACATHMMRRGAPLRHVQELLGHRSVTTTEVYTRLNAQEVLEAHARFHPREQPEGEGGGSS